MGGLFSQGADGGPPVLVQVMPLLLLGIVFYMLLVRPEQKRRREHDQLVAALKRNDHVVMTSGIHGRVAGLGDKVVTVEIAPRVQVQVDRSAIQTVEKGPAIEAREKEREKS
ncbi:MAG TPA: preprotein translocase subunit YajC [Candidatus Binatus sp.]|nr:preprotein translocase subunit YajC [Candidatus Binatus sp.]